jgi:hypothetical protein
VFDKKDNGNRLNLKMILPTDYDINLEIEKFRNKIIEKYKIYI